WSCLAEKPAGTNGPIRSPSPDCVQQRPGEKTAAVRGGPAAVLFGALVASGRRAVFVPLFAEPLLGVLVDCTGGAAGIRAEFCRLFLAALIKVRGHGAGLALRLVGSLADHAVLLLGAGHNRAQGRARGEGEGAHHERLLP